jgi:ABC-2 type transport system permease protein
MMSLMKKTIRDHRIGLSLTAAGLLFYDWFLASLFPTIQKINLTDLIAKYPKALKAFFGIAGDFSSFEGFINVEFFSLMWVIIVVGFLISFATSEVSREIETGTIESLLSLPLSRMKIIFSKWLSMSIVALFLSAISTFPILLFAMFYDISANAISILLVFILCFLFAWAVGSFTIAMAVLFNERSKPVFIPIALVSFGYIWNSLGRLIDNIKDWRFISLFYYFDTARALTEREISLASIFVLSGIILVSTVFAFYWFSRRDFAV